MKNNITVLTLFLTATSVLCQAGDIDGTQNFAWSENAGWINFMPSDGGLAVYAAYLNGFAWCETAGWISLGSGAGPYGNTSASDYGVNIDSSGNLSGYAWAENAGWINFRPTDGGVSIAADGTFSGFAWSGTLGWINFQNASPLYGLQISVLSFTSTPVAAPNPAGLSTYGVGQTITFSALAAEAGDPPAYDWNFGDGFSASGANPSHAYSTSGLYTVTVTATDPNGKSISATMTVNVAAPVVGTDADSTGDGYSDSFLDETGYVPSQPATANMVQSLAVSSLSIKLNFVSAGNDSISMSGILPLPSGFSANGQKAYVVIGGVMDVFTLGDKGASAPGNNAFSIKPNHGTGGSQTATYSLKLSKGSFAAALAANGLVRGASSKSATTTVLIPAVTLIFNNTIMQTDVALNYKASDKNGLAH
jgi:PKD repeat protein